MKAILVSTRVEYIDAYNEKRDALDQRWLSLMYQAGFLPIVLPNHLPSLDKYIQSIDFAGVLLTGGNDLSKYGGTAPERDFIEQSLLEFCIKKHKPLIGVCRGMQVIQDFFGVKLQTVKNHIQSTQSIICNGDDIQVNSYHCWGSYHSSDELIIDGKSDDGVIKAIHHRHYPIYGFMWHPERIEPFTERDLSFFRQVFNS